MKKILLKVFLIVCVAVCLISLVVVPCFANEPYNENFPVSRSVDFISTGSVYKLADDYDSYIFYFEGEFILMDLLRVDAKPSTQIYNAIAYDGNHLWLDYNGGDDPNYDDVYGEAISLLEHGYVGLFFLSVDDYSGDFLDALDYFYYDFPVGEFDLSLNVGEASIFINPTIVNDNSSYITIFVHDYSLANDGITYGVTYRFSGSIYTVSYVNDLGEYVTEQRFISDGWYFLYFDFEVDISSPNSNYVASYLSVVSRSYIDDIVSVSRQDGYRVGFDDGETEGYNEGVRDGYDDAIEGNYSLVWRNVGLFLRNTLSAFTDAQLFLGVTIGGVLSLVVGVGLFLFIIKLLR